MDNMKLKKKTLKRQTGNEDYVMYTETNRRRKITKKIVNAGVWTNQQNLIYIKFLQNNQQLFSSQFERRSQKIFKRMAVKLRRRDLEQCRSHHQKYMQKFNGNIQDIINHFRQKKNNKVYQRQEQNNVFEQNQKINKQNKDFTGSKQKSSQYFYTVSYKRKNEKQFEIAIMIDKQQLTIW